MLCRSASRAAGRARPARALASRSRAAMANVPTSSSGTPVPAHVTDPTYVYIPNFVPMPVAKYVMRHMAWTIRERETEMRGYGLWMDDFRDESPDVPEAEARLTAEETRGRIVRRKRAGDLSLKHKHLPREMWPTVEEVRTPYMRVPIHQIRSEWIEKERFADVLEGRSLSEFMPPPAGIFGFFPGRWYKMEWDDDAGTH